MKALLVVLALAACGGPPRPPIHNEAAGSAEPPAPPPAEGTAKVIGRDQQGGRVELHGDHDKAMESASKEMSAHCGEGNYTITQEGEERVTPDGDLRDTVWRVHYQCF